jgi:hypothetical protein
MGYYLYMMFEPGTIPDRAVVIQALKDAGFRDRVDLDEEVGEDERYRFKPQSGNAEFLHLKLGIIARYHGAENPEHPGEWGDFRVSWENDPQQYKRVLTNLFLLAQKAGFKLYDGQMKRYLDEKDLEDAMMAKEKVGKFVASLLGEVRKQDPPDL